MGFFDKLKKLFSSEEDQITVEKVVPETPARAYTFDSLREFSNYPSTIVEKGPVESVDERVGQQNIANKPVETVDKPVESTHQHQSMHERPLSFESHSKEHIQATHKPQFIKQEVRQHKNEEETIKVNLTGEAIQEWEKTMVAAQQHPLSQVKILNTQILEELTNVLKSMDIKLNKLEDLDKMDLILELLQQTKDDLTIKGVKSSFLDDAMKQIDQLTIKDKEVLQWIERQERVTASQLADYINLSRSTASFRLNRLEELGTLEKEAIGKKIYYKIKKQDQNEPQIAENTNNTSFQDRNEETF